MLQMKIALTVAAVLGLSWVMPVSAEDAGPHKGQLIEWGEEEYHLELVPDAKAGTGTVYVYGDAARFGRFCDWKFYHVGYWKLGIGY